MTKQQAAAIRHVVLVMYYKHKKIPTHVSKEHAEEILAFHGWGELRKDIRNANSFYTKYVTARFFGGICPVTQKEVRPVYSHEDIGAPTAEQVVNYLLKHCPDKDIESGFIVNCLLFSFVTMEQSNLYSFDPETLLNSYYTPKMVIDAMWRIIQSTGFDGGNILDPCAGSGMLTYYMPERLKYRSKIHLVEVDALSSIAAGVMNDIDSTVYNMSFEKFEISSSSSYDLVIANVPFGRYSTPDTKFPSFLSKHDYFIAKSCSMLRDGGIACIITSTGTMDKTDGKTREYFKKRGISLVGAIRLPAGTFHGTDVTSDILILQRSTETIEQWNEIVPLHETVVMLRKDYNFDGDKVDRLRQEVVTISVNEYFSKNTKNILGEMTIADNVGKGGLYSGLNQLCYLEDMSKLPQLIEEAADNISLKYIGAGGSELEVATHEHKRRSFYSEIKDKKINVFYCDQYGFITNGSDNPVIKSLPTAPSSTSLFEDTENSQSMMIIKLFCNAKQLLRKIIQQESNGTEMAKDRELLNKTYDTLIALSGSNFCDTNNKTFKALQLHDVEYAMIASLHTMKTKEEVNQFNGKVSRVRIAEKSAILKKRVHFPSTDVLSANSIEDALNICMNKKGKVDLPYIAKIMSYSVEEAIEELTHNGLVFKCPLTGTYIHKEEYLSGNIKQKIEDCMYAGTDFNANIEALTNIMPADIAVENIMFSLRSRWMPIYIVEDFLYKCLRLTNVTVAYVPSQDRYQFNNVIAPYSSPSRNEYASSLMYGHDLACDYMNMISTTAYKKVDGKQVKDEAETQICQQKQGMINDAFVNWLRSSIMHHDAVQKAYNEVKNACYINKTLSIVSSFEGMSGSFTPYAHQVRGVSRFIKESGICWHPVGSGKTRTMIGLAMEAKRLGTTKSTMIVVQNSTIEQFVADAKACYPQANILYPSLMGWIKEGKVARNMFMVSCMTGEWDIIIVPASFIDLMPDRPERVKASYLSKMAALMNDLDIDGINKKPIVAEMKRLEKKIADIDTEDFDLRMEIAEKRKADRLSNAIKDDVIYFEDLVDSGIMMLLIDEVHRYKRGGIVTKMQNVKGVDTASSNRALSMYLKLRYIQSKTGGKNTVGFSGTVISNTMAELWTMINMFRPDLLIAYGVETFDKFAADFGDIVTDFEMDAGGQYKETQRFSRFINIPELLSMVHQAMDIITNDEISEYITNKSLPTICDNGMTKVVIEQSEELRKCIVSFRIQLLEWQQLKGAEKAKQRHIPLVIFGQAKKAAISMALITGRKEDCYGQDTKVYHLIKNCSKLYHEYGNYKAVQLIFSDTYQHYNDNKKVDFSLYDFIVEELVNAGIPKKEIAIIGDYSKEGAKEKLFEDANNGNVRFIIGSTERLGTGVNVQERCIAMHHIDIPNRPSDYEQRNGRGVRKGNTFAALDIPIFVFIYLVKGGMDVTAANRIKTKSKFILQVMTNTVGSRSSEDISTAESFSEIQATLMGESGRKKFVIENRVKQLRLTREGISMQKTVTASSIEKHTRDIEAFEHIIPLAKQAKEIIETRMPNQIFDSVCIGGVEYKEDIIEVIDKELVDMIYFIHNDEDPAEETTRTITINGFEFLLSCKYHGHIVKKNRRAKKDKNNGQIEILEPVLSEYKTFFEITNYVPIGIGTTSIKGKIISPKTLLANMESTFRNQRLNHERYLEKLKEIIDARDANAKMYHTFAPKIEDLTNQINELSEQLNEIERALVEESKVFMDNLIANS